MRRSALRSALLLHLLLLPACGGGGGFDVPALTDDSTCEEAEEVVAEAIDQGRAYIGLDRDDLALADQLVFALSAVDERPECFDAETISTAQGLRSTLASTG